MYLFWRDQVHIVLVEPAFPGESRDLHRVLKLIIRHIRKTWAAAVSALALGGVILYIENITTVFTILDWNEPLKSSVEALFHWRREILPRGTHLYGLSNLSSSIRLGRIIITHQQYKPEKGMGSPVYVPRCHLQHLLCKWFSTTKNKWHPLLLDWSAAPRMPHVTQTCATVWMHELRENISVVPV